MFFYLKVPETEETEEIPLMSIFKTDQTGNIGNNVKYLNTVTKDNTV